MLRPRRTIEKPQFTLSLKPDLKDALRRWEAFWNQEVIDRPVTCITVQKDPENVVLHPHYEIAVSDDIEGCANRAMKNMDACHYLGDAIPAVEANAGPDQFGALLGGTLMGDPESFGTTWVKPCVDDWDRSLPLGFDHTAPLWKKLEAYTRALAKRAEGKCLVQMPDCHSNLDALSAIRTPQKLCMDLYDFPEKVAAALKDAQKVYSEFNDLFYQNANMDGKGTISWLIPWHRGRTTALQCDFIGLISPDMADRFVIPALREEAALWDRNCYHYDGVEALVHRKSILEIEDIHVIQWVPGTGQPGAEAWLDFLLECQTAGKSVQVGLDRNNYQQVHKVLDPSKVCYTIEAHDFDEGMRMLDWLSANT